jgi:hypothetical protein
MYRHLSFLKIGRFRIVVAMLVGVGLFAGALSISYFGFGTSPGFGFGSSPGRQVSAQEMDHGSSVRSSASMFLTVNSINGESTDESHSTWIEIL